MPTFHPVRTLLSAAVLAAAATSASAVPLVGLTSSNQIASFDSANVAAATSVAITGLAAGDRFIGIDLRPTNQQIYGITLSNQIYTLNASTGAATFVAALSAPIINSTLSYGIDFNPVADASGAASLRLISSSGNNYAINASTGAVTTAQNIGAGFSNVAYLPTGAGTTSLYYINATSDALFVATTAFNTPTINSVGLLGIDVLSVGGFEINSVGQAFAALNTDNGPSLATGIYGINLANGAPTLLGTFNGTLSGLALAAPVPEPGTYGLMGAGLLGVAFVVRRRQRRA